MIDVPEQHCRLRERGPAVTKTLFVPEAQHGTLAGFAMGCRCLFCVSAKATTTPTIGSGGAAAGEEPEIGDVAVSWYLRSLGDHDTHRGTLCQGSVIADCGIRFAPRPVVFGRTALPGNPLDPEQVCPECFRARRDGPVVDGPGSPGSGTAR